MNYQAAIFAIVALFVIGAIVLSAIVENGVPAVYRDRSCLGREWHRRFPSIPKAAIREFLAVFSFDFAIKRKYVLLFGPDDELMTIYRAANHKRLLDNMEFEILAKHMQKKYRVNLEGIWHEHLTLGELFSKTLSVN